MPLGQRQCESYTHSFSGQISHSAVFRWQNGSCWQNPQSQQMSKVTRIGLVTAMLKPFVLFDRRGVGQMHRETSGVQTINQPVPVKGRFNDNPCQLLSPRYEQSNYFRQVVG